MHIAPAIGGNFSDGGDGNTLRARCPSHHDRHKALDISVAENDRRRIVAKCHAGCTEQAIYDAIIAAHANLSDCLPRLRRRTNAEMTEDLSVILKAGPSAESHLQACAIIDGYAELPTGDELAAFAAKWG